MTLSTLPQWSQLLSEPDTLTGSSQVVNSNVDAHQIRREVVLRETRYLKPSLRHHLGKSVMRSEARLSTETSPDEIDVFKIINLPVFKAAPGYYNYTLAALQEWEGKVESIDDYNFYASLVDLTNNDDTVTELAEIPLDEISDEDRARLATGAIFRWVIGYANHPSGRENTSRFYFRRFSGSTLPQVDCPALCFETDD